jgi:hypothetical protein
MHFVNATDMEAGYTVGPGKDGRELLVVVVKGTFAIPTREDEKPTLTDSQAPLVTSDVYTGEPGFSAPLYEIDYAACKPKCDVLLNGSCYAPDRKPTDRVTVSLKVGSMRKSFNVVGHRTWKAGTLYMSASAPQPFTVMPISYNNAFGGIDRPDSDPTTHTWYPTNHAGVGYHKDTSAKNLDGKPLPNTEEIGQPISKPDSRYRPMAFGPIGRAWEPRVKLAGTYDQNWRNTVMPFLPPDFQEEYFQSAPTDQQIDYPHGGETVELRQLTPGELTRFTIPRVQPTVAFHLRNRRISHGRAVMDTFMIEPDLNRFMMTWRYAMPLRKNLFEIHLVEVANTDVGET